MPADHPVRAARGGMTRRQRHPAPPDLVPETLLTALADADRDGAEGPDAGLLALVRESGVLATAVPRRHGGAGGTGLEVNRVVARVARANPSVAIILFQHFAVSARIAEWGTAAVKRRYLPRLADGTLLAASAWSEPGAGAAKRSIASSGVRREDGRWVLNGHKSFTTGSSVADVYLVLVQTDAAAADGTVPLYGAAGQTFFLVGAGEPGLEPDPELALAGMRSSATGFVGLRGCVVRDSDRLGAVGQAPEIIAGVRRSGATLGSVALGVADAALDLLIATLRRRGQLEGELVRHRLVELATRVESARALVEQAGRRDSADPGLTTLHSKLLASEVAEEVCLGAARLLGSEGYLAGSRMNRLLADARAVALMGPTNELCRELVARGWAA